MEFLLVPVLFGLALLLLSIGKLFGRKGVHGSCKAGEDIDGVDSCEVCGHDNNELKLPIGKDEDGMENVAKLSNPNRHRPFSDKFDFRPERFK